MSRLGRKEPELGRLLVEGKTDQYAIAELMKWHGFDFDGRPAGVPEIQCCGNDDGVIETLPIAIKTYSRVGLVIDANGSMMKRWEQLRSALTESSIQLANSPALSGVVTHAKSAIFGFWIMPGNCETGYLEDFLGALVDPSDPTWPLAEKASLEAQSLGAPFRDIHLSKARLHTWLAWREAPGSTFGVAFQGRWLRSHSALAIEFAKWFSQVFPEGVGTTQSSV